MAEAADPILDSEDAVPIKSEPEDIVENEVPIIPKEYVFANGIHEDSDCEDVSFFTQTEVENTRKCLENTRLIIKDFETQLDWHLQQYMMLRNVRNTSKKTSKNAKDDPKRKDLFSISQLSALIANHPEGNKKFIKRKGSVPNGRKRGRNKDTDSEEESDYSDEDSDEYDVEDYDEGHDSEDVDDPGKKKKKGRGRKKAEEGPVVKDEIEEEEHELIEPKQEVESDEEMPEQVVKKSPPKRGGAKKKNEAPTPSKRARGKKKDDTVDLTNLKTCRVILNRIDGEDFVEIKSEDFDKDELVEMLKNKGITSLEDFEIDEEKPIFELKNDNMENFDFTECKTSNVVVTFEDITSLPEIVFIKDVANHVLNNTIKLVQNNIFEQHLSGEN